MLKKRGDEFIADMKAQHVKGHADMREQTAEAVDATISEQRADITRLQNKDRQHFVKSLAEAMKEVTSLRHKYHELD